MGKHVTGALPYGYLHDPDDRQKRILDEESAPVSSASSRMLSRAGPCQN